MKIFDNFVLKLFCCKVHELKKNGKNIPVNESNKKEYVKLYVNYRYNII